MVLTHADTVSPEEIRRILSNPETLERIVNCYQLAHEHEENAVFCIYKAVGEDKYLFTPVNAPGGWTIEAEEDVEMEDMPANYHPFILAGADCESIPRYTNINFEEDNDFHVCEMHLSIVNKKKKSFEIELEACDLEGLVDKVGADFKELEDVSFFRDEEVLRKYHKRYSLVLEGNVWQGLDKIDTPFYVLKDIQ